MGHPGLRSGIQCIHQLLRNSSKTGPRVKPGVTVNGARVTLRFVIPHWVFVIPDSDPGSSPLSVIPHSMRDPVYFFVIPDYDPGSSVFSRRCAKAPRPGPRVKPGVTVIGARGDISLMSSRTRCGMTHHGFNSWRQRQPAAIAVLGPPGSPHQSGRVAIDASRAGSAGPQK